MRRLLAALTALFLALVVSACSDLVVGDSLVVNATVADGAIPSIYGISASTVDGVTLRGYSGAAPCDYFRFMQGDYDKYLPKKISFAWSGNNGTPCMLLNGQRRTGSALALKYHDDLAVLTKFFLGKGVKVIYSAPLCTNGNPFWPNGDPVLRSMESRLASAFRAQGQHVAYSDYAALQICPGWKYNGAVRAVDGLHLSPAGATSYAKALRYESKHVFP